jgi:hypothetical protein
VSDEKPFTGSPKSLQSPLCPSLPDPLPAEGDRGEGISSHQVSWHQDGSGHMGLLLPTQPFSLLERRIDLFQRKFVGHHL